MPLSTYIAARSFTPEVCLNPELTAMRSDQTAHPQRFSVLICRLIGPAVGRNRAAPFAVFVRGPSKNPKN
jgi:hypothetical protein